MTEMVPIRSVKQYWNDYIVNGLGKGVRKEIVKGQLLDSFQKEVFGQVAFKLGVNTATMDREDLAQLDGIQNILHNSFRKWRRLCILCMENGIRNFIQLEDLKHILEETTEEVIANDSGVRDGGGQDGESVSEH